MGVARFTFEELCARPLGASDYLKLARRFHTLVIDDIPVLGAAQRNEAKRFIALIDALYEARVKLVASAQTPPEGLDAGGAPELARAVSRLQEMQSQDYLAAGHQARGGGAS